VFIELTEILRCPNDHLESYMVAAPMTMDGRRIVRGVVGCPECQAEFPIVDGVVYFGAGGASGAPGEIAASPVSDESVARQADEVSGARDRPARLGGLRPSEGGAPPTSPSGPAARPVVGDYDSTALATFLNLSGPGGYAVLVGAVARFGADIVAAVPGVHIVAVNAPPGVAPSPALSLLRAPRGLPLKSASVRAVALGADLAAGHWLGEALRVLLPGLRLVVEDERASSEDLTELARGGGLLVGEKRPA
jgi:hypothetical protein